MSKTTGGAAFPVIASEYGGNGPDFGMTLRDCFAAKAMQAILSNPEYDRDEDIADAAYFCADAMLAERDK